MQMEIKKIKKSELELAVKMRKTEEERRTKSNANKVVHKSDIRTNYSPIAHLLCLTHSSTLQAYMGSLTNLHLFTCLVLPLQICSGCDEEPEAAHMARRTCMHGSRPALLNSKARRVRQAWGQSQALQLYKSSHIRAFMQAEWEIITLIRGTHLCSGGWEKEETNKK